MAEDGTWPEAEVNLDNLNVGFGDMGYQGVKESEAEYIEWGADPQLTQGKDITSHIYFLKSSRPYFYPPIG